MIARHDYQCIICNDVVEFFGEPSLECPSCHSMKSWRLVFTEPTNIHPCNASVLEKIDEVNAKIREETMHEEPDKSYDGDKW